MAITNVPAWSTTAASNVDLNSVALDPAVMVASQLPPTFQQVMAQIASFTRRGADTATASTLNLDTTPNMFLDLTGTTTVTAVTLTATHSRRARAQGAFTLTASATLVVNGSTSVNYTTTAGDLLFFEAYTSATVRVWAFASASVAIPAAAATADFWAATSAVKYIPPSLLTSAGALTTLTDAATITVDMSTFINATVTLGGNRTLGNQSNQIIGRSGVIYVMQDGTGSRTLAYASNYKFTGGVAPVLTTTASAVDRLTYFVRTATHIDIDISKDRK